MRFMQPQNPSTTKISEDNEFKSPFYCSICTETKGSNIKRIKCSKCARFICMGCFESIKLTGMNKCPYCSTNLAISDFKNGLTSTVNLVEIGVDKMDKGLDEQAKYYFLKAIDIDSKSMVAWKRLGMLYFSQKNWERAVYCFTKVLKLNPHDKEAKEYYIEADHRIRSYY